MNNKEQLWVTTSNHSEPTKANQVHNYQHQWTITNDRKSFLCGHVLSIRVQIYNLYNYIIGTLSEFSDTYFSYNYWLTPVWHSTPGSIVLRVWWSHTLWEDERGHYSPKTHSYTGKNNKGYSHTSGWASSVPSIGCDDVFLSWDRLRLFILKIFQDTLVSLSNSFVNVWDHCCDVRMHFIG